jgi:hypothetical protein
MVLETNVEACTFLRKCGHLVEALDLWHSLCVIIRFGRNTAILVVLEQGSIHEMCRPARLAGERSLTFF